MPKNKEEGEKLWKRSGITLIALVITIIVLLILSGTAVTVALDGEGLFGKANTAVQKWNNKVEEEENINSALEYLNELIDKKVYTKYTLGQEVTVGGEQFFVIEEDTTNKDTITLIAKYNLKTNTNDRIQYIKSK